MIHCVAWNAGFYSTVAFYQYCDN